MHLYKVRHLCIYVKTTTKWWKIANSITEIATNNIQCIWFEPIIKFVFVIFIIKIKFLYGRKIYIILIIPDKN